MPTRLLSALLLSACATAATQNAAKQNAEPTKVEQNTPPAPAPVVVAEQPKLPAAHFDASLPERQVFFGNPERTLPAISPNGKHLAYLAPKDGVMNIYLAENGDLTKAKPISDDKKRGIRGFFWAYDNKHILYSQDKEGDENWRVYSVDIGTATTTDLTPMEKVHAQVIGLSEKKPGTIVVGLNDRVPELHDLYTVEIATGAKKLLEKNEGGFASIDIDDDYVPRTAMQATPDGGTLIFVKKKGKWEKMITVKQEDSMTTGMRGFDATGKVAYWQDSTDRNTAALFTLDLATGKKKLIAEDERVDLDDFVTHPTKKTVQAVSSTWDKTTWKILDKAFGDDFAALQKKVGDGELSINSRSLDDE